MTTVKPNATGTVTSATTVSSGESHSMIASETRTAELVPRVYGTIPSSPWTCCRSELARETTWPVRRASCCGPSSREIEAKTRRRRSCWTPSESRPPR